MDAADNINDAQHLKNVADNTVLLNAADNTDAKDHHHPNADKNDAKDLNDGEPHLQNTHDNLDDNVHLQNAEKNDDKDHLQNGEADNGKDLQNDEKDLNDNADKDLNDGRVHLQNTDNNDTNNLDNDDYSEDEDLHDGDYPMFEQMYRCYPVSYVDKAHLENGNKVLMPSSALEQLAYSDIDFPILFELSNLSSGKVTHCGVLEFTATEGTIYLPTWMMEFMLIKEGDFGVVKYTSLPKATYVKLQPHTTDFLDVSNPKAVLERVLRGYSCLTTGGTIVLPYNDKKYYVDIVETKPSAAVCIIDTDCEVDFAPPLDYKEPEKPQVEEEPEKKKLKAGPFTGSGRRLDGKPSAQQVETVMKQHQSSNGSGTIGSTSAKQQSGTLVFGSNAKGNRKEKAQDSTHKEEEEKKFKAFTGKKYLLKDNASS